MILTNNTIKQNFKICSSCNGERWEWRESHDCWGRDDSYQVACFNCAGNGFTMTSDLNKQIKKVLGL